MQFRPISLRTAVFHCVLQSNPKTVPSQDRVENDGEDMPAAPIFTYLPCVISINVRLNASPILICRLEIFFRSAFVLFTAGDNLFLWREKQLIYCWRVIFSYGGRNNRFILERQSFLKLLSVMNLVAIWSVEKHICNCNLQASSERNYISVAHTG